MKVVREAAELEEALELSLVLEASGIAHELVSAPLDESVPRFEEGGTRFEEGAAQLEEVAPQLGKGASPGDASPLAGAAAVPPDRWLLLVAGEDFDRASAALAAFEAENAAAPEPAAARSYGDSYVGGVVALALIGFATFVGPRSATAWFERGSADAEKLLRGEWWRAATALTLHADAGHAAGNAVAAAILLTALASRLGPALAVWVPLVAGVAGNVATAEVARHGYVSVGASTAVFAALGTLSALQAPGRRAWVTLGAGVALLGFLGTGERSDLLAHLFGFGAGAILGAALRGFPPPRRSWTQAALAASAAIPLAAAWWRALP